MSAFKERRAFLFNLGVLAAERLPETLPVILPLMLPGIPPGTAGRSAHPGYVLAPGQGEHLIHFRDQADIFIKGSAATGSRQIAFGTQQVKRGTGIPVHRHLHMHELFYVVEGSGIVTLDEDAHSFGRGATIYIPSSTWHGFNNPDGELLLFWTVTPPGLDAFFRETCTPPGVPRKQLSKEEIRTIALKYGTEFR
jgi:quercetin dioxygenase-like cupin family protein